jgi:hypothetical protein
LKVLATYLNMKNKKSLITLLFVLAAGIGTGSYFTYLFFTSANVPEAGKNLFGIIGGGAGVIAAIAYSIKTYGEHVLGLIAEKHRIVFANTYKLRADAIAEGYGLLLEFADRIEAFSHHGRADTPEYKQASDALNKTKSAYLDLILLKGLYLPKETKNQIKAEYSFLHEWYMKFFRLPLMEQGEERQKVIGEFVEIKFKLRERHEQLGESLSKAIGFRDSDF